MDYSEDEQFLGRNLIPGVTSEAIVAELAENPLVVKYWKKNTQEVQERLIDTMMRKPSASDCPGYIYGFRNLEEYDPSATSYNIKMGRTKRQVPQQRIFEWERDDNHQYVEIFTIRSEFNMKLEALVHLVFAYARKTLVINGKNRIEWFTFDEKIPTAAVVNLVNMIMEKIHESECKDPQELSKIEKDQMLINNTISNYNQALRVALDYLKSAIFQYSKRGETKCIDLLKEVLKEESLDNTKKIFEKIIEIDLVQQFQEKLVFDLEVNAEIKEKVIPTDAAFLIRSLENVLKKVNEMEAQEKLGIKFNYILGRIKEAVYFGFKGGEQLQEIYNKFQESAKLEEYKRKSEAEAKAMKPKFKKGEKKVSENVDKEEIYPSLATCENTEAENTKDTKKSRESEEIPPKQQQYQFFRSKSNLSDLYMDLSSIEPGETIVNVFAGDFRVNCSKRVNHSIFLLAKCIKVYEDWNIKFSSTASESKLNLVIMGKEIVNIDKLKIPKKSLNGVVSILSLDENGELEGLDDFLRSNPHKLKSKFYEGIKKIYKDRLQ